MKIKYQISFFLLSGLLACSSVQKEGSLNTTDHSDWSPDVELRLPAAEQGENEAAAATIDMDRVIDGHESEEDQKRKELNATAFQVLLSESNKEPDESIRIRKMMVGFRQYFNRNFTSYYIAFGMMKDFDRRLKELYELQRQGKPYKTLEVDDYILKLNIVRALFERNQHRLFDLYENLLAAANDPSNPYSLSSRRGLSSINGILKDYVKEGNGLAVMNLAYGLEEVNREYLEIHPTHKTLTIFKHFIVTDETKLAALEGEAEKTLKTANTKAINNLLKKKWEKELADQYKEVKTSVKKSRDPQSEPLFPSAGGEGNVTGNMFPPGVWALTLDDGPHPVHTAGMIEAMKKANIKGSFYWLAKNIQSYPNMVSLAQEKGHNRALHSFSHANLPKLSSSGLKHEISEAADVFEAKVGSRPTLFRCPYGACGKNGSLIRKMIADNKMLHSLWNVDSLDWQDKNPKSIYDRVVKQMELKGRGIVLFHDIHPQSVKAVELLMAYIQKNPKLQFYPMHEAIQKQTGKPYPSP